MQAERSLMSPLKENLWEFMINVLMHNTQSKIETVFKAKNPKKYIQVKPSYINNESQILAICTDVTRIK